MPKKLAEWILSMAGALLIGALGYAVVTSYQNQSHLAGVTDDIKSIKKSLIRISFKTNPGDPSIATGLVSDTSVGRGLQKFKAGEYPSAYSIWSSAAKNGDNQAAFAIFTANAELKKKAVDPSLPPSARSAADAALRTAPAVVQSKGKYVLKYDQH